MCGVVWCGALGAPRALLISDLFMFLPEVTCSRLKWSESDMSVDPENGSRNLIPRICIPDPFES